MKASEITNERLRQIASRSWMADVEESAALAQAELDRRKAEVETATASNPADKIQHWRVKFLEGVGWCSRYLKTVNSQVTESITDGVLRSESGYRYIPVTGFAISESEYLAATKPSAPVVEPWIGTNWEENGVSDCILQLQRRHDELVKRLDLLVDNFDKTLTDVFQRIKEIEKVRKV